MKALLRLSAMMGLIGAATIGSWFYAGQPAQALPTEKVVDILKQAPIFTVLTPQQQPIPLCQEEVSENTTCPPDKVNFIFFVNPQDAMTFKQAQVNQLPDGSEAKKQLQALNVGPVSLSVMYEYLVNTQDKENAPRMSLIPDEQQLEIAKNMMGQDFESIPIYLICYSNEEECQQPIFGDQLLPFFFEESEAKKFLGQVEQNNPDSKGQLRVDVTGLENIFGVLNQTDDEQLQMSRFILSDQTTQFLQEFADKNKPESGS